MEEKKTLQAGDLAPNFILNGINPNCEEKQFELEKLLKKNKKGIILYFYPRDNTSGCTAEAKEFTDLYDEFEKLGYNIYGISKDSLKSHCNFIKKHELKISLLSDPETKILQKYGAWGEKKMYGKVYISTIRSTFIIDKNSKIQKVYYKVKAKGHAEKVLEDLKNLNL